MYCPAFTRMCNYLYTSCLIIAIRVKALSSTGSVLGDTHTDLAALSQRQALAEAHQRDRPALPPPTALYYNIIILLLFRGMPPLLSSITLLLLPYSANLLICPPRTDSGMPSARMTLPPPTHPPNYSTRSAVYGPAARATSL